MVFHIILPEDWKLAVENGTYTQSTRGCDIKSVGYVHASGSLKQVIAVAERLYSDRADAFVIDIDDSELHQAGYEIRYEPGDPDNPQSEKFPHIYGGELPVGFLKPAADFAGDPRILREDSPEVHQLNQAGWTVGSTSWGARLFLDDDADLSSYHRYVDDTVRAGFQIRELTGDDLTELYTLDRLVAPDFPSTPASHHEPLPDNFDVNIADHNARAWGAFKGDQLVGFSIVFDAGGRWEVDRTSVHPDYRRRGVAKAMKSASVLETYASGVRQWGTGGASINQASLRMNKALGFVLEPLWLTMYPPLTVGQLLAQ
ncbi:GNAT family N-acetyltransferase [Arcanobacterium phocae]|uniref:GNAT family N-acetyltransferase n=1 Tax=Arcanobacterium phocae TaxID=131112 RepID=UPI001C0EF772|nr:GNAT family N-acetyltransferase [Arcanobacterium phocae]